MYRDPVTGLVVPSGSAPEVADLVEGLAQFSALSCLLVQPAEDPSSTLHVAVAGGVVVSASARTVVAANPALALVASSTNYVYVNSSGALAVNQTAFPTTAACAPLAVVVTNATNVVSIVDARFALVMGGYA